MPYEVLQHQAFTGSADAIDNPYETLTVLRTAEDYEAYAEWFCDSVRPTGGNDPCPIEIPEVPDGMMGLTVYASKPSDHLPGVAVDLAECSTSVRVYVREWGDCGGHWFTYDYLTFLVEATNKPVQVIRL